MEITAFYGHEPMPIEAHHVSETFLLDDFSRDPDEDGFILLGMDVAFRLLLLEAGLTGSPLAMSERQARIAAAVNEAWDALRQEVCLNLAKERGAA